MFLQQKFSDIRQIIYKELYSDCAGNRSFGVLVIDHLEYDTNGLFLLGEYRIPKGHHNQDIVWSRIKLGVTEQVEDSEINPDYSLTMTNVGRGDTGTYFATAANTEGTINGPPVELEVIKKPSKAVVCIF